MNSTKLPLVSVVTPVYNGAQYLDALIQSVQQQTYPLVEHIIIDDGSSDDGATLETIKKYSHLRWWTRNNLGQYYTMNEGLQKALGEIICFISADDIFLSNAVFIAVQYLTSHKNCVGVYGNYSFIDAHGKKINHFQPMRYMPTSFYPYSLHIAHSSFFINKKFLIKNGYYFKHELRYVGDYEWIIRVLRSGKKVGRVKENLSSIRLHGKQTSNVSFYKMRKEVLIVQKNLLVSPIIASFFRKILFVLQFINVAKSTDIGNAFAILFDRIRIIFRNKNENNINK